MMLSNIPDSWQLVKFGESCTFSQGIQVDVGLQSEIKGDKQVRFLRIVDFTKGDEPPRYIDHPGERYYLSKEEIAMVRYGTVGFVCTGKEGVIANNLFKITPQEFYCVPFLRVFLQSDHFKSKLESKGATMQALSFGLINPIEIPLPPLAEQHRIVTKIEELFSDLDKGIETLKTAKEQLKVYRQAVLKYAFEGRLTNADLPEGKMPDGWEKSTLGDECDFSQGIQIDVNLQSEIKGQNQVRFLRIVDFTQGDEPPRYIDHPGERYYLSKEEIAMVRYGTVGFVCTGKEGVIANNLFKIIPSKKLISNYLIHFLKSELFKSKLESKGATMQALSFGLIRPISIYVPPLSEQTNIIQEIESRLSICNKIEESIEQGLQQAEALRQSILKKAFEGKLVPQDSNDEPAQVLLERIKSELAAAQPSKILKSKTKEYDHTN